MPPRAHPALRRLIARVAQLPRHPFKLARALAAASDGGAGAYPRQGERPRTVDDLSAWTARSPVLHVDDEIGALTLIRLMLEASGLHVISMSSPEGVADLISRVPISLLISDVMMPGMDGFELCRRLRDDPVTNPVPVMFLTPRSDTASINAGFEAGAVGYALLPVQHHEITAAARELLLDYGHWQRPAQYDPALVAQVIQLNGSAPDRSERATAFRREALPGSIIPARPPYRRELAPPMSASDTRGYYTLRDWPLRRSRR